MHQLRAQLSDAQERFPSRLTWERRLYRLVDDLPLLVKVPGSCSSFCSLGRAVDAPWPLPPHYQPRQRCQAQSHDLASGARRHAAPRLCVVCCGTLLIYMLVRGSYRR